MFQSQTLASGVNVDTEIRVLHVVAPCRRLSGHTGGGKGGEIGLCNYGGLIDTLFTDVEGVA